MGPLIVAALTGACSSDRSETGESDASAAGPLYVVHSTIDTNDVRVGYLVTTSSIEGDVAIDLTKALEVPGGGYLYAPPTGKFVLLGGSEAPTFTRYQLDGDGRLRPGKTVSFAQFGVSKTYRHLIFESDQQAYFLDESQLQIVRFNPTTMEVDHAIPVKDFKCPEKETTFGTPIRREDGYYFPRGCWDLDVTSRGASLVHFDPRTEQVTVTHDGRCMGMQIGFLADSGDAYWFSDQDASVEWTYQKRDAPHDCALRLRKGQTTFDKDWELDLTSRAGGVSAIAAVPAGGARVWVKVFEPAAFPGTVPVQEIEWGLPAWRWGLLDVEGGGPIALDHAADLVVFYGYPIVVDGRSFSPVSNSDFSASILTELTAGGVVKRLRVAGELRKVFRLR